MTMRQRDSDDRDLLLALRRLAEGTPVPPVDPSREEALLRAFDAARQQPRHGAAAYWWMAAVAAAAAVLIAVGVAPLRKTPRTIAPVNTAMDAAGAPRQLPGEFIPWPGARDLPPLESGQLVRIDLPVSMLPSLGIVPPPSHVRAVKADLVVGQDGLARAVRLVGD